MTHGAVRKYEAVRGILNEFDTVMMKLRKDKKVYNWFQGGALEDSLCQHYSARVTVFLATSVSERKLGFEISRHHHVLTLNLLSKYKTRRADEIREILLTPHREDGK